MTSLEPYFPEISAGFLALCLIVAAIWDMAKERIPNFIPATMICGFLAAAFLSAGDVSWGSHFGAAGIMLVITLPLFQFNWMGGGDAKLLIASALWFGLAEIAWFGLFTALAGGVLALLLLSFRPVVASLKEASVLSENSRIVARLSKEGKIPYGVAIAVGGLYLISRVPDLFS